MGRELDLQQMERQQEVLVNGDDDRGDGKAQELEEEVEHPKHGVCGESEELRRGRRETGKRSL